MKGLVWGQLYSLLLVTLVIVSGANQLVNWEKLLDSLSNIGDFLVGVAALGAIVAYPWQKQKDRDVQVDEERRTILRSFLTASENYFVDLGRLAKAVEYKQPKDTFDALNAAKAELSLFVAGDSLHACMRLQQALIAYHSAVKSYLETLNSSETVKAANKATRDHTYEVAKEALLEALLVSRKSLLHEEPIGKEQEALALLYKLPARTKGKK
ncbi:hypothetical protein [Rhodobacter lacus]|uniref:Uncharacterized protein n=1 Tax=Rhodobacter lacus TaxID=1641972 RepID=A0ABW5AAD8_9RHOB